LAGSHRRDVHHGQSPPLRASARQFPTELTTAPVIPAAGNGTQKAFYDDPSILYVSIHRYDDGAFYPNSDYAANWRCGVGEGIGKNVNIAWGPGQKGDSDYIYAFQRVIIPICQEFAPELIFGPSPAASGCAGW